MSQKLSVDGFKWVENTSQFNIDFIWNYDQDSAEGYLFETDVQYHEQLHNSHNEQWLTTFA